MPEKELFLSEGNSAKAAMVDDFRKITSKEMNEMCRKLNRRKRFKRKAKKVLNKIKHKLIKIGIEVLRYLLFYGFPALILILGIMGITTVTKPFCLVGECYNIKLMIIFVGGLNLSYIIIWCVIFKHWFDLLLKHNLIK